ncbi:Nucleoporin interacting component family protein [Aphelenchoides avenae]|nr:Nucleoporin interacting component family protein [Aphelenchus avenae]
MNNSFDDVLQRASKLTSTIRLGHISEFPKSFAGVATNAESSTSVDCGLSDLSEIFKASEEIWQKKQLGTADWTKPLTGALQKAAAAEELKKQKPPSAAAKPRLATHIDGYDDSSLKEIDKYVANSIHRARLEAERAFLNQQVVDTSGPKKPLAPMNSSVLSQPGSRAARGFDATKAALSATTVAEPLAYEQNVFAAKIDALLNKSCRAVVRSALKDAVQTLDDRQVSHIWDQIHVLCKQPLLEEGQSVIDLRTSKAWAQYVVKESTAYLQEQFRNHMEAVIESNLAKAQRGGVPGTLPLIEAYLNVKEYPRYIIQDGYYGKHPVWSVLFHCLRLGDFAAATTVAKKQLMNIPACSALVGSIISIASGTPVEGETRNKLSAEWRHETATCRDIFKRATYGLILDFESPEVDETIENWLWSRLTACQLHPERLQELFRKLQADICIEYGEEYFFQQSGDYSLYFTALWLTGQLERAVDVLFRAERQVHAVHAAILAYQLQMLVLAERMSSQLLAADVNHPILCRLNFARMLLLYVKNFELTNVNYALNYCFFLHKLEFDAADEGQGGNVFEACVSRIVYLSHETDQILGRHAPNGDRVPGLIDKFEPVINVPDIIARVASDTNVCGDAREACRLYALAQRPNDAIKLMCKHLSVSIVTVNENSEAAVKMAKWLANRYREADSSIDRQHLATLFLLIDLYTFFKLAHGEDKESALRVIQKLQFIPFNADDVQSHVSSFHMIADEVRAVLPEVCLTVMKLVVDFCEDDTTNAVMRQQLQAVAKVVMLYSAMIPYRFPVHINSQLLQLQSHVS